METTKTNQTTKITSAGSVIEHAAQGVRDMPKGSDAEG